MGGRFGIAGYPVPMASNGAGCGFAPRSNARGMPMQVPPPVRAYVDAYNARDVEGMLRALAEDVHFQNITSGTVNVETNGIGAFADLARTGATAFQERRQEIVACIVVGDRAMIEVDYSAVVGADLPNGWKAGQALRFRGKSYFELRDGRIVRIVDEI